MPHTPLYTPFQLFSPKDCKRIIKFARRQHDVMRGWTVGGIHAMRTNSIYWLHPNDVNEKWCNYHTVKQHLSARPNLPVDWIQEHWQISVYQKGELYDWHRDSIPKWKRTNRKSNRSLTLTCTLRSAPDAVIETEHHQWDLPQGWAVLFPADDLHRATPPSSGERWALTAWGMKWNPNYLRDDDTEPMS